MSRTTRNLLIAAAFVLAGVVHASAQVNTQNHTTVNNNANRIADNPIPSVYGGYQIGVGDILDIHVNDEEDVSGRYQVDQEGNVKISLLRKPIPAAGTTTFQLANLMTEELKLQQILRDPS